MTRRSFDDRVRDLVRTRDAESDASRRSRSSRSEFDAPLVDLVARALALPMPRRRAIGLISGALLAGGAWRPGRARAQTCAGDTPKTCQHPGGAKTCVPSDYECCTTEKCARACRGYQRCTGLSCSDTPKLCGHPEGNYPNGNRPKFCSVSATASNYCTDYQPQAITIGWCCRAGEVCGSQQLDCVCRGTVCGEHLCCEPGEVCETNFFGTRTGCVKKCDDGKAICQGICCKGDLVCTPDGCACPGGTVQRGIGNCVAPKEDPGDPPWNPLRNFLNMMSASGAAHGGSSRLVIARPAQSGSSALDAALVALAAVNGQAAAAQLAFGGGKRDPAFRRKVVVARVRAPTVAAGAGLDTTSAAAINKMLAAEAKAYALMAASAKALWRARAAKARGQRAFAKAQLRASSKFAGQAASALRRVPALRTAAANALTAGGVAEVTPTEDQVRGFLAIVKSSGIPAYLRPALGALGVTGADLKRVRSGLLDQTVTSGLAPALIAPLKDPEQAKEIKLLISRLSKYSTRARRHPIAR